jgi:hypothetical protein
VNRIPSPRLKLGLPRGFLMDSDDVRLHLTTEWITGAEILAGTCLLSTTPSPTRLWRDCGCGTTVFGNSDCEVNTRLAAHRRRCHG